MSDSCKVNGFQSMARSSRRTPAARVASREQLPEAAKVSRTLREYLADVESANPMPSSDDHIPSESVKISATDPDATWATKGGVPAQLSYYDNYLIDYASNAVRRYLREEARSHDRLGVAGMSYRSDSTRRPYHIAALR